MLSMSAMPRTVRFFFSLVLVAAVDRVHRAETTTTDSG